MADSRDLLVRIIGDDRSLQQAFTRTERRTKQFEGRMSSANQSVRGLLSGAGGRSSLLFGSGAFLSTAAITAGLAKSIQAASDLNEEVAKSRQLFGAASGAVESWAQTTADGIGVARVQALAATGTFGNLFSTVGLGQEAAAGMSQELVQLAADLASFNNADISDVLAAIRSGLIGEAEPLRRYGVLLSEARVQQLAMATTGKGNVKELTNQEKALARFNIILQDTTSAQGDFARTSDGLANQTRILRAQLNDLSADLGTKLLPGMVAVVRGANDLIDAFTQAGDTFKGVEGLGDTLEEIDISQLVAMRDRLAEVKGEGNDVVGILDQIIERLRNLQGIVIGGPDSLGGARGPGAIAGSNALVDERNRQRALEKNKKELERSRKAFADFIKGLGLKLDRAGLTADLSDDLAVLREIERAIKRRIRAEGRTFELVQQLTDVQLKIAATVGRQQAQADQRQADAEDRAIEQQQKAQEAQRDRLQRQAERRQGDQFEALGQTRGGDQRVPGVGALRRRLGNLRGQVEGTVLDTAQTEQQLDRIASVLAGKFGKVGRDVRAAILAMFNDISNALGEGGDKVGPLTKTTSLNSKKLLAGIGLSPEEIRELRGRLSGFNSAGIGFAGPPSTRGAAGGFGGAQGRIVVESHVTVQLDGQKVGTAVTRSQQKTRRRNPKQKRGPNRNR